MTNGEYLSRQAVWGVAWSLMLIVIGTRPVGAGLTGGLVAHWTFDDADVSGTRIFDVADDAGDGKGDHNATLNANRSSADLPGDPDGGLTGQYLDANYNGFAVVDTFTNGASHADLEANDGFTVAGWFRERPDGVWDAYVSKRGEGGQCW